MEAIMPTAAVSPGRVGSGGVGSGFSGCCEVSGCDPTNNIPTMQIRHRRLDPTHSSLSSSQQQVPARGHQG